MFGGVGGLPGLRLPGSCPAGSGNDIVVCGSLPQPFGGFGNPLIGNPAILLPGPFSNNPDPNVICGPDCTREATVIGRRKGATPFFFNGTAWVADTNYVKPWYSNYFDACFVVCPPVIAAGAVALTPGTGEALFARGGLFNDNAYFRVGTGTARGATRTNHFTNFRVSIGGPTNSFGIWWHIDLPWIPGP